MVIAGTWQKGRMVVVVGASFFIYVPAAMSVVCLHDTIAHIPQRISKKSVEKEDISIPRLNSPASLTDP